MALTRVIRWWRELPDSFARLRPRGVRAHLTILCAACILPMLAVSVFVSWRLADLERGATRTQMVATSRAISGAVDLKLQNALAALSALATSPALSRATVDDFYRQCVTTAAEHNAWILLVDPAGNELINTQQGPGNPGRRLQNLAVAQRALATATPQVSGVFVARDQNSWQVSTYLPVFRETGNFVLIMSFKADEIGFILAQQNLPATWTVSVIDRNDTIIARSRDAGALIGSPVVPNLAARMKPAPEGTLLTTTRDGIEVFAAFARSAFSGWAVAIGIPVSEVTAPLLQSFQQIAIATILMLLAGMGLAALIGGHLARSLDGLAHAALALADNLPWRPVRSSVREVNEAVAAQQAAEQLLRQHARERDQAEALLRDAVDSISEGFVIHDPDDRLVMCNERYRQIYPKGTQATAVGQRFEDILRDGVRGNELPEAAGREEEWIAERMRRHREASGAIEQRLPDGRWLLITERRMRNGGIAGLRIDISKRKRAEADAEAARARMTDWAEAANDWFWETDADLRFTFMSEGFEKATGMKVARMLGRPIRDTQGLESDEQWQTHLARLAAREPFRDFVKVGRARSGRIYYISVSGKPVFAADGTFTGYRGSARDVTAQIEAERALAQQTQILSTMIENLPIGVCLVDRDLRFIAFNRRLFEIYDIPPGFLKIGDSAEKLLRYNAGRGEYGPVDVESEVSRRMETARRVTADHFERTRPNGQIIEVHRIPLPGGGFVLTYIDVTAARRREADLEEARSHLERQAAELDAARITAERAREAAYDANAAKSLFLANMSHELRTPLNAILGFSEVMDKQIMGPLGGAYRSYAHDIHASGQYLLRLISDLLDLSKIEAGQMELHDEDVDLGELVVECKRLILERADDARVAVETCVALDLPGVSADRLRLKQVLLNLLSNAVKFTPPEGRVTISGSARDDGGVVLAVADTGIGMRPEEIGLALEPFRQVGNAFSRRQEGTGLGLPLAKTLTEMHGGALVIRSEPGRGTLVEIVLPPHRVLQRAAAPARTELAS